MIGFENSRRRFLSTFLWYGFFFLTHSRFAWAEAKKGARRDSLTARLQQLLRHPHSAVIIGREYVRLAPNEREPTILLALIVSSCGEGLFDSDCERTRESLRLQTRRDFEEGRVVEMHGWMLSITEARLCALAALVLRT